MKNIIFLAALITLISQTGCQKATDPAPSDIYVNYEIESGLQNDSVKVVLDNQTLVESRVTTNYTINLAWSSGLLKLSKERHTLHFAMVEYGVQKDYATDIANDTSTVLLRFDKNTHQISVQQIKGIILRD